MNESMATGLGATRSFPDRLRLPLVFDIERLLEDLKRLHGIEWIDHFVRQNYDGSWSVIPLRAQVGATHPVMMIYSNPAAKGYEDTPLLGKTPYFREVVASFRCPIEAVRLMRLTPGSVIKEHRDGDLDFENGAARLHIPITTNPDVDFRLNGARVTMTPGSCWYLRFSDPHSIVNRGTTDRVHLVIDMLSNDWLRDLLTRSMLG